MIFCVCMYIGVCITLCMMHVYTLVHVCIMYVFSCVCLFLHVPSYVGRSVIILYDRSVMFSNICDVTSFLYHYKNTVHACCMSFVSSPFTLVILLEGSREPRVCVYDSR